MKQGKIEGIVFADLFITNKEQFVDIFREYYQTKENATQIDSVIQKLHSLLSYYTPQTINKQIAEEFERTWLEFKQKVLFNYGDQQLLVAYRDEHGNMSSISQILKQADTMKVKGERYGIDSGDKLITDSMQALKGKEVEIFMQKHLNTFLNQIYRHQITDEQAKILYNYHKDFLRQTALTQGPYGIRGLRLYNAFYDKGSYWTGQGQGQAYDAYMNHMANHEKQIFNFLRTNGQNDSLGAGPIKERKSVYIEEGGITPHSNLPRLLGESKNHIGWYTGGDIIIVNPKTMGIVYNIQLKTTGQNIQSVFPERITAIRTFITQLQLDKSPENRARLLFDFLLTSVSNNNDFNKVPLKTIEQIVQKEFLDKLKNF